MFSILPRKGYLAGEMRLRPGDSKLSGQLAWRRTAHKGATVYPGGFGQSLMVSGEPYSTPAAGENVITGDNSPFFGSLTFERPYFTMSQEIAVDGRNGWTNSEGFSVRFDPVSGFFFGHFRDSESKTRAFRGAVFQSTHTGLGHFMHYSHSGMVKLIPQP